MTQLFHQLLSHSAENTPEAICLTHKNQNLSYEMLEAQVNSLAKFLLQHNLPIDARVGIYLPKQFEAVTSFFAATLAGGVFVPINPLLKPAQVDYILSDCEVSVLITSKSRYQQLKNQLTLDDRQIQIILTDCNAIETPKGCYSWQRIMAQPVEDQCLPKRNKDQLAAILYTSGSTGNPKGVVLSHNNLVSGAKSVAQYLANDSQDRLLAVLPFSFDYGLSQITTAFLSGAELVLMEYLLPKDVIRAVEKYQITGLAAVPPLWVQLAELEWSESAQRSLRYLTNSGGAMPQATLANLMQRLPFTKPFLMYGLTEAFRSTYLDPAEIPNRPTSMGKAIPDAQIYVVNGEGDECQPGEPGELVHRGPHVAQGYWNDAEKTALRFKPLPKFLLDAQINPTQVQELVVWSGDTVVKDEAGFLYFVGRQDDMIKSSGYRISPSEIEDCVYQHASISEVAAIGIPDPKLGQAVVLVIKPKDNHPFDETALYKHCKQQLPNFMQPKAIHLLDSLPRNPNGKINRKLLAEQFAK